MALQTLRVRDFLVTPSVLRLNLDVARYLSTTNIFFLIIDFPRLVSSRALVVLKTTSRFRRSDKLEE
jgi:hypothetical protein